MYAPNIIWLDVPAVASSVTRSQWPAPDKVGGVDDAQIILLSHVTVAPPVESWQVGKRSTPPFDTPEKFIVTAAWPSLISCCVPFSQFNVIDDDVAGWYSLFNIVPAVT